MQENIQMYADISIIIFQLTTDFKGHLFVLWVNHQLSESQLYILSKNYGNDINGNDA